MLRLVLLSFFFGFFCGILPAQIPLTISQIQGDGLSSPYVGQVVSSDSNIVTATFNDGFFIQSAPGREDDDSLTSEGLLVYLGTSSSLTVGDLINISGPIKEYQGETEISGSPTQWTLLSSNYPLPDAILLDADFPSAQLSAIPELERVEGMRVYFSQATVCGPGFNNDPSAFYLGTQRPFREAGIKAPGSPGLPVWDNNPELIFFDQGFGNNNQARLSSGMELSAEGVLTVNGDHYMVAPLNFQTVGDFVDHRARPKVDQEVSIGCLNALFLDSDASPSNMIHRQQIAIYVVDGMKGPNIIAFQEVENLAALRDVANRIRDLDPQRDYEAYLLQGNSSSINLGYLIDRSVSNVEIKQLGKSETISLGGTLHNRPPLLLTAEFATVPPTPIQILNVHLKSLNGIEGGNSNFVRTKRHEGALSVARMVQDLQSENLIVLGDFNAFPFSDGYVDVLNQISGQSSLGAERPVQEIVHPPLENLSLSVSAEEQYSYVYQGNAQILDHCLSNELQGMEVSDLQYIRGNADNPDLMVNNPLTPQFSSDHDGFVVYLQLQDSLIKVSTTSVYASAKVSYPNPFSLGQSIEFSPAESGQYQYEIWTLDGQLIESASIGFVSQKERSYIQLGSDLGAGMYVLKISGDHLKYSGKLVLID